MVMQLVDVIIPIDYSQLCVFNSDIENPYNDWTDDHVRQGFSWRNGESVSFGISDGVDSINLSVGKITSGYRDHIPEDIIRLICLPFRVTACGVEIGSIFSTIDFDLDEGVYNLYFLVRSSAPYAVNYYLLFEPTRTPVAELIVGDWADIPSGGLLLDADPAI